MKQLTLACGLFIGLLNLSACTLLPESDALSVYQFAQPSAIPTSNNQPLALSLRINTPQTGYAYSGSRLMVQTRVQQLLSYKGVRWSDPTPTVIREYLAQAFQQRANLSAVTTDEQSLYADVYLSSDLRRFQVVDEASPYVLITLQTRLIDPDSRRIHASHDVTIKHPISSTQIQDVLRGYQQASDTLANELLDWALPQLATIARNTGE